MFLDVQPINPGHLLVVPVTHATSLRDLDAHAACHAFALVQRAAAALRVSTVRADGVNVVVADGEAAGQEVPHVHLHVIPRFTGDRFHIGVEGEWKIEDRVELDRVASRVRAAFT